MSRLLLLWEEEEEEENEEDEEENEEDEEEVYFPLSLSLSLSLARSFCLSWGAMHRAVCVPGRSRRILVVRAVFNGQIDPIRFGGGAGAGVLRWLHTRMRGQRASRRGERDEGTEGGREGGLFAGMRGAEGVGWGGKAVLCVRGSLLGVKSGGALSECKEGTHGYEGSAN